MNDVALAASVGGLRRLLRVTGGKSLIGEGVRAMVPVSVREASQALALGNRVSSLFVDLPAVEADPHVALPTDDDGNRGVEGRQASRRRRVAGGHRRARPTRPACGRRPSVLHAPPVQRHDHERARFADDAVRVGRAPAPHLPCRADLRLPRARHRGQSATTARWCSGSMPTATRFPTSRFSRAGSPTRSPSCGNWRVATSRGTSGKGPRRGTSRGTELSETQLISAHLSVPDVTQDEPTERLQGIS